MQLSRNPKAKPNIVVMWFRLQHGFLHHGSRWQSLLAVVIVQSALLLAMLQIAQSFRSITGFEPFDFQPELTVAAIERQLPSYTADAIALYDWMALLDFGFPLLGGMLWTLLLIAGLRLGWPAILQGTRARYWLALPFAGTLCDWAENILSLNAIHGYPPLAPGAAALIVYAKQAKMAAVTATGIVVIAIFLIGLMRYSLHRRFLR